MREAKLKKIREMKTPVILMNPEDIKTLRETVEGKQTYLGIEVMENNLMKAGELLVMDMDMVKL